MINCSNIFSAILKNKSDDYMTHAEFHGPKKLQIITHFFNFHFNPFDQITILAYTKLPLICIFQSTNASIQEHVSNSYTNSFSTHGISLYLSLTATDYWITINKPL